MKLTTLHPDALAHLRTQLVVDEKLVRHVYPDSRGYWTIAVGRLVDQRLGGGLSVPECMFLLDNDIAEHSAELIERFPLTLTLDPVRQAVLGNMAFNLGVPRLAGFKNFLREVWAGHYHAAEDHMIDSDWHTQTGDRAKRLEAMMRSGLWL